MKYLKLKALMLVAMTDTPLIVEAILTAHVMLHLVRKTHAHLIANNMIRMENVHLAIVARVK